ncbi:MAG: potassium transporter TrkG [Nitrososphaera sp.]
MLDPLERAATSYMHRQFVLVNEDIDVATAVQQMQSARAETIIVVRNDGSPVGIITDSDILDKVVIKGEDTDKVFVKSIMTAPIITISTGSTVRDALQIMKLNKIKRIPVRDSTGIVGIVTQKALADSIRTHVLERTFRSYRATIRERYKPVLANMGFTLQFAGILMVAPAFLGTILGETESVAGIYLAVVGLFGTGFLFSAYGEKGPLSLKESSILVVSSFILLSLFGSIPYMYTNPFWTGIDPLSLFINSFFESASGFTTTGLSTIVTPEELPLTFDFYRSYTHWVGGLSFVYLVMLVFYPEKKLNSIRGLLGGGILQFKQLLVTVSVIFTTYAVILSVIFYALGGGLHLVHDISFVLGAITGGGFVPDSRFLSLANTQHLFLLMPGMVISALPFAAHYSLYSHELRTRILGIEVATYLLLLAAAAVLFVMMTGLDWITSSFHVVSASTNSGFQFIDIAALSSEGKTLLIVIMLIGGSAYSAAGGIKVGRFILMLQGAAARRRQGREVSELVAFSTRSSETLRRDEIHYDKRSKSAEKGGSALAKKLAKESVLVVFLFISLSLLTGYALSYLNDISFLDSTFEAVSALTTSGLSAGLTSVELDLLSKSILIMNMIAGKFEIIVILYIFFSALRRPSG